VSPFNAIKLTDDGDHVTCVFVCSSCCDCDDDERPVVAGITGAPIEAMGSVACFWRNPPSARIS
jgi:hypothetical protein